MIPNRLSASLLVAASSLLFASPALAAGPATCYDWEEVNYLDDDGVPYHGQSWWGVNNRDVFVGNFCYDTACDDQAAVVYDSRTGTFESFRIPGYADELDTPRINDHGVIAGSARNSSGDYVGFVRDTAGTITLLPDFIATDIDNANRIVGYYPWTGYPDYPYVGAILSGEDWSEVEYYAIEEARWNGLWGSDDHGGFVVSNEDWGSWPYYRYGVDLGGGIEWIDWAPLGYDNGAVWGLNNRGQAVGNLADIDWSIPAYVAYAAFIWYKGVVTEVTYDEHTSLLDINDHGVIAGSFDNYHQGLIGWPVPCGR